MFETITPIDYQILDSIQDILACPALDSFFSIITHLGDSGFIWIVIMLVMLCVKKLRPLGVAAFISLALVTLFGEIAIKMLVARPRPFITDPSIALIIAPPDGYSFPSIHSASSFGGAVVMCALPYLHKIQGVKNTPLTWAVVIGSVILALLIAFSRLYVQVHFPSDVLMGAVFGIVCGLTALWATKRLYEIRESKK